MRILGTSPKGNQPKWYEGDNFYKQDYFVGESLAEYLVSVFLESSNCPIPFLRYRLVGDGVCVSKTYKPRYSYLSFGKILDRYLALQPYAERLKRQKVSIFNYWYKNKWLKLSVDARVKFILERFEECGVLRRVSLRYLTCMIELDTLVLNIDRHFNNFGLCYDTRAKTYQPMFLFDNGLSLGVGEGQLGSLRDMLDLRKVKMQPFASRVSKNRAPFPTFRYAFDVRVFVQLLDDTSPYRFRYLRETIQFRVLKFRLKTYYGDKDKNGVVISDYFNYVGL